MKSRILFLNLALFFSISAFSQATDRWIRVVSFEEKHVNYNYVPQDEQGFYYAIMLIHTNLNSEEARMLSFSSNKNVQIRVGSIKDNEIEINITSEIARQLSISHPDYGSIDFSFPCIIKPGCTYSMDMLCEQPEYLRSKRSSEEMKAAIEAYLAQMEMNANIRVYDRNGDSYSKGVFITMDGQPYLSIKKDHDDEYLPLIKSDKKEFKYMTIGESEKGPYYVIKISQDED